MSDAIATPSAPAASSTPSSSSSSSPSSAPSSAPASAPAAAGGTPPATPAATPAATPTDAERFKGKSVLESVKTLSHEAIAADKAKETPVAAVAPPEPAKAAEEVKIDPVKVEEVKKDDAVTPAADEEGFIPDDDVTLEELGLMSPTDLADEKWKAFLDANPEEKGRLGKTLRVTANLAKVAALGINSERQAKFVLGQTQLMADIESSLTTLDAKDDAGADGYQKLVGIMGTLDLVRDEETGEPIKDEAGNFQRHGYADAFLLRNASTMLDSMEQHAEASQDPSFLAAVRLVKERITRPSSASDEDLSEHQKTERENIRQERQKLNDEKTQSKVAKRTEIETTAREASLKDLNGTITRFLGKTALDEFAKDVVAGRAATAFFARLDKDQVFKQQRDYLISQPQTKTVLAERRALVRDAISTYLPGIMTAEFKRAGATQMEKQKAADTTRTQQEAATRHEIKGGGGAPVPATGTPQDAGSELAAMREKFVKENNRKPNMVEDVKMIQAAAKAQRAASGR